MGQCRKIGTYILLGIVVLYTVMTWMPALSSIGRLLFPAQGKSGQVTRPLPVSETTEDATPPPAVVEPPPQPPPPTNPPPTPPPPTPPPPTPPPPTPPPPTPPPPTQPPATAPPPPPADQNAAAAVSLRAAKKVALETLDPSKWPVLKLSLPNSNTLDCALAVITITLAPGSPELDPEKTHLVYTGRRPDEAWYKQREPPDRRWYEWNEPLCKWMPQLKQCSQDDSKPPSSFSQPIYIHKDKSGKMTGIYFPDSAALEYEFSVVQGKLVDDTGASMNSTLLVVPPGAWTNNPCRPYQACGATANRGLPTAHHFGLFNDDGSRVECGTRVAAVAGTPLRLWIKPFMPARVMYPQVLPHIFFTAIMESSKVLQPVNIGDWDDEVAGYPVNVETKDSGDYDFRITLQWYYGKQEIGSDPPPFVLGAHIGHLHSECDKRRSSLYGCNYGLTVGEAKTPIVFTTGDKQCTTGDEPGRWYNVPLYDCKLPWCTGDRKNIKTWHMFTGEHTPWVYTPYTCHYHQYTSSDINKCVGLTGKKWLVVIGDSTVREVATILYDQYKKVIIGRFEEDNMLLGETNPLRVSFQFQHFMYDLEFKEHRDFNTLDKPLMEKYQIHCPDGATECPDVALVNPAMCYVAWKQTLQDYEIWIKEFVEYLKMAMERPAGPRKQKLQVVWYSPPMMWSQAHSRSSPYITEERIQAFAKASIPHLKAAGIPIIDTHEPTRSIPKGSWDGTHYLRVANEAHGAFANMMMNMFLNVMFKDCEV